MVRFEHPVDVDFLVDLIEDAATAICDGLQFRFLAVAKFFARQVDFDILYDERQVPDSVAL